MCHNFLHQLADPLVAVKEIRRVCKPSGAIIIRDVRRLPAPWMEWLLPLYCVGYSPLLRKLTYDSFRAGLTHEEFLVLVKASGIERARVTAQFITHQGLECPAASYAPWADPIQQRRGRWSLQGAARKLYVSRFDQS